MTASVIVGFVITSGLLAGFFFSYWCSVMLGLRNVDDDTFVQTMQSINAVLPNARFSIPFFGPVLLSAVGTWKLWSDDQAPAMWWMLAAVVFSMLTFAITAARNVPMNNALAESSANDRRRARELFESPWVRWNNIRTLSSVLAFAAGVLALVTMR